MRKIFISGFGIITSYVIFILALLVAYGTHIVWAINALTSDVATQGKMVLAIIGAIAPPIGIIHGFMLWL